QRADAGERADEVDLADEAEVGEAAERVGDGGDGEAPPGGRGLTVDDRRPRVGDGLDDDRDDGGDDDADEQARADAPGDEDPAQQQAEREDGGGPRGDRPVDAEADGDGRARGVREAADEAGVDKADHGDEQADATAIAALRSSGIASKTAFRKPLTARITMIRPSMTMSP